MFRIKLYTASVSEETRQIAAGLEKAIASLCNNDFSMEVINVLEHPELADRDGILATPTAVRFFPEPQVRVIGSFRNMGRVLEKLGLKGTRQQDQPAA